MVLQVDSSVSLSRQGSQGSPYPNLSLYSRGHYNKENTSDLARSISQAQFIEVPVF